VVVTKNLGHMSARQAVTSKIKSKLLAVDEISAWFFRRWCEEAGAELRRPEDFFFPLITRTGDLDFGRPMTNDQHGKMCRAVAAELGLAATQEELGTFASNCVRRGCAATLVGTIQAVIKASNKRLGRAPESSIDLSTYAPDSVVLQPGPLFEDVAGIAARVREHLSWHLSPQRQSMLCLICGYPKCECLRCGAMQRGSRTPTTSHTCWLAGKTGRAPRRGRQETEEEAQRRADAWAACGCETDVPIWVGARYGWPEEAAEDPDSGPSAAEAWRGRDMLDSVQALAPKPF
jgi:hypothetical protein